MLYKEMNYTQKRQFEATLTPHQRRKMRKMEQEFKEQAQPIAQARHKREDLVRKESWVSLNCAERIKEVEAAAAPRVAELRSQIQALQDELNALQQKTADTRCDIQTEVYTAAYSDPEVKALDSILQNVRQTQAEKFQKLVDSFAKVDA